MKALLERVRAGDVLIADGAMGTMLMARGLAQGACPESMNLDHPEVLVEIAKAYLDAGAEIIQTNTFGGSPLNLAAYKLDHRTEEIVNSAVMAVKKAASGRAYVSGSCGPSGKLLKPYGDTDPEEMSESFKRQLRAMAAASVDLICVETMTDIAEAVIAVKAAKEVASEIPVMATMTFDHTPRGYFTVMGVTIRQAARELAAAGADIVGSNCGNGIERMIEIAREFKQETDLPIIIQSNAGLPEIVDGDLIYKETPEFMAEKACELVDIGVSIIGGCCGTTPEHIATIKKRVLAHRS